MEWINIKTSVPAHLEGVSIKLKNGTICDFCVFHHLRISLQGLKDFGATDEYIENLLKAKPVEYEVTHWTYDNEKMINVRTELNFNEIEEWAKIDKT